MLEKFIFVSLPDGLGESHCGLGELAWLGESHGALGESERQEGPNSGFFDIYLMETCLYHIRSTLIRFFDIYDYNLDLIKDIYQLIKYSISLCDN